jgi:hypothetical protein
LEILNYADLIHFSDLFSYKTEMAGATSAAHPGVLWAQRARLAFVTVEVSDCENPEIKVKAHT